MIIGITGTNGAGKGTVVEYLAEKGFTHYSVRAELIEEIKRRGMPVERPSMRMVGDDLRAANGPGYFVERFVALAKERGETDIVMESLRSIGEVEKLHELGGILFAVDADRKLRYERSVARGSDTDKVGFDTWVAEEEREWHNTAAHEMNVPAVMAMADYTIANNGTVEKLRAQVDRALATIHKEG
ncbi:MAG: AAA family ATPase [Patescibacteria group bacterium]|nr:AAA family ATPase [Patescibacteria group bacterium]MDE1945232.1 AAA family ATPase [Patescibacteria group bacterium]MDE2057971.1 AAA family ATPase [Patescibacteria group bacterium]